MSWPKAKQTQLACAGIWLLHALLLAFAFPISELISAAPLYFIDSPFHQYQVDVARELWNNHALVGYDPWFAGGHIGGVNYNASAKLPALLAILLGEAAGTIVAYKLYVFAAGVLAPGFVWWAMCLLKTDTISSTAAMILGVLLWWISSLHWYHTAGMVAFVIASYAALPYIVLVWRGLTHQVTLKALLGMGMFGAFGMFVHPLFPLPILFTVPMLMLADREHVQWRSAAMVAGTVPLLCILPNLPWIWQSLYFPGWSDGSLSPYQKVVDIHVAWQEAIGLTRGAARGARLNPILWLLVTWGVWATSACRERRVALSVAIGALCLIIFAALAGMSQLLGTLQPNRLSAAAYVLLVIPAALGAGAVVGALRQASVLRFLAMGTAAVLLFAFLFCARELANEVSSADTPHYGRRAPEVRGEGELTQWLTDWISSHTSDQSRILFETSLGRIHDGAHIAGPLARATQREFIGGPYVFMHHAGFWDGEVFGRQIGAFTSDEFMARLTLYNVGWVIVHSPKSKAYMAHFPGAIFETEHGPLAIYRIRQPASYFVDGSGMVLSRGIDKIELVDVVGTAVTLKYHYVDGLTAGPGVRLEPVFLPVDPKPFVRIINPPGHVLIRFSPPVR